MSVHGSTRPVTVRDLQTWKQQGERFVMMTAYDATTAGILDDAGVPVLLVGDSLGMVVLGYDSTVPVTMAEMLMLTAAVRRGSARALVVGDLPFGSVQAGPEQALADAIRFLKEAGAGAVKLEGGAEVAPTVARLVAAGIPVMGHVGLTPQHVHRFGGYRVQGRDADGAERIVADARALEEAGAFAIVAEAVPTSVGRRVTEAVDVPVIGIGAGPDTDAQVLVVHDLLGLTGGRLPRFVKQYADLRSEVTAAVKAFTAEVADGEFPAAEHCYEG